MQYLTLKDIMKTSFDAKEAVVKNSFPREIGTDYMEQIKLQEDLFFLKTEYHFLQSTRIEAKQEERKFVMTFSLKGEGRYINANDHQIIPFKEGFTTLSLLEKTEGFREFQAKEISQVRLILTERFLLHNLKESVKQGYLDGDSHQLNLVKFAPTPLSSQLLVNEMLNCPFEGELASLYLQGKALELLSLEMGQLAKKEEKITLDAYDKEKIYQAKHLLLEAMHNPPSLAQLAKRVHLNEQKLKMGFKQVFSMSPYQLLLKYKMQQAKKMLESGEFNINEVARMSGYKFANNFTNAFYKEFGVLPKALKKHSCFVSTCKK